MGSRRPADRRRRRSRRSSAAPTRRKSGESLFSFSYKRLLQAGSAAAALGSILALAFTVGDRALGLFGSETRPEVQLERVTLEKMPYRTYLVVKERVASLRGEGGQKLLDSNGLAVDFVARVQGSAKGVTYPVRLTIESRDAKGRIDEHVDYRQIPLTLDASDDECVCHEFFFLGGHSVAYRVNVQILRPHTPNAEPLAEKESEWYTP
jgi:hypothetical protein